MSETKELELTAYGTTSIGALVAALEGCVQTATIQFDFCYTAPADFASYRGFYDHLAIGWNTGDWPRVAEFLPRLEATIGREYEGWKGGEYTMRDGTPIWVANRGETGYTAIVSLTVDEGTVVINTRYAG